MVMRLLGEEAALCLKNRDKTRKGEPVVGGARGLHDLMGFMDPRPKVWKIVAADRTQHVLSNIVVAVVHHSQTMQPTFELHFRLRGRLVSVP